MNVTTKEELNEIKRHFPEALLTNPAFANQWYWAVEYKFEEIVPIEITIFEDGKGFSIVPKMKVDRQSAIPEATLSAYEFRLNSKNEMEVTNSYGVLMDSQAYYVQMHQKPENSTSLLDVNYRHSLYDANGIEQASATFTKYGWPLKGYSFEYDMMREFQLQLLSKGLHMPANWNLYLNGPELPTCVNEYTSVSGIARGSENPSIARTYNYDVSIQYKPKNQEVYLAQIHGEYPERLRVDKSGRFAKLVNMNWNLYESYDNQYEGKDLKEVMRDISLQNEANMENRMSTEHDEIRARQYAIMQQALANYNQRFREGLEQSSGMRI